MQLERSVALCQEFHHVGHLEFRSEAERLAVFSNSFDSGLPWREAMKSLPHQCHNQDEKPQFVLRQPRPARMLKGLKTATVYWRN